ncbi:MAG: hypothetical protein JNL93_22105 [Pelomonas sp.]|nr:hypothetical protein [Roseateles sp.]
MKPQPTPRRLLTLNALFARRRPLPERHEPDLDTRLPDDAQAAVHPRSALPPTRRDLERALDEGTRRQYPMRGEAEVLERH